MTSPLERTLTGLDHLEAVTTLLQRIRSTHPTSGLWEAADRQWSWRNSRSTDDLPQLFWFDEHDQPVATVITTASAQGVAFDPIVLPDAPSDWIARVIERGLEHAAGSGFDAVDLEVDRADHVTRELLLTHGFSVSEDGVTEAWVEASALPGVSELHEGYRLMTRAEAVQHGHRNHHMTSEQRGHSDPEARLRQTSLYRADLDLVVYDNADDVAAYGLFWFDPVSMTALVEPMRTEDDHQQRGLARHVLTTGLNLLAAAGAERIKICYDPGHPASGHLYRSVGFEPDRLTDLLAGPTRPPTRSVTT